VTVVIRLDVPHSNSKTGGQMQGYWSPGGGGLKMVPMNSLGRVSYLCSLFSNNYRPMTHRSATIHERDQPTPNCQPTNDITTPSVSVCASRYSEWLWGS